VSNLAIITGASRGLGLALASSVPFPARVVDISRSGPPVGIDLDHLEADLSDTETWGEISARIGDLLTTEQPERAVFIHAAGTLNPIGFAGEVDSGAYTRSVLLNCASGQVLGHAFLTALRDRKGQFDLVMVSSGAASATYAGWSAYSAGKAALDQWVRTVGSEQRLRGGVRVSAIAPGVINTPMQADIREMPIDDFPAVGRFHDLHREGELVEPDVAARKLWAAIETGLESGSVLDLRDL